MNSIAIRKRLNMKEFKDMEMPAASAEAEEEFDFEFGDEEAPTEGADLSSYEDDELIEELEKRGFVIEAEEEVEPVEDEEMSEEE